MKIEKAVITTLSLLSMSASMACNAADQNNAPASSSSLDQTPVPKELLDSRYMQGIFQPFRFGKTNNSPTLTDVDDLLLEYENSAPTSESENHGLKEHKLPTTRKDFINIIKKSKQTLKNNPNDAGAYIDLGYACRNLDDYTKGVEYCNKAISLDPNIAVAYSERAQSLNHLFRYEEALNDLDRAIKIDPNNSAFYSNRGWVYIHQEKFQKAIEACNRSIEIYAGYSPAFFCRALAYLRIENYKNAIADTTEAIKLYPNEECGYYIVRAIANARLKNYEKALPDLRTARLLEPKEFRPTLYAVLKDHSLSTQDAVDEIFKALSHTPDAQYNFLSSALLHRLLQEYDKAFRDFNRALKLAPDTGELYRARGAVYLKLKDYTSAISDFTRAIELDPKDVTAYKYRSLAYIATEDFTRAIVDLTQVTIMQPTDYKAFALRASAYAKTGDVKKEAQDRLTFAESFRNAFVEARFPDKETLDRFLQRDLDKYFTEKFGKPVRVEYKQLQEKPTQFVRIGPAFCYWVTVFDQDRQVERGAVSIAAFSKNNFTVMDFLKESDIKNDALWVYETFPETVCADIFSRAGISPAPEKVISDRPRPGGFKVTPDKDGFVKFQWRARGTNVVNEKTMPENESKTFLLELINKERVNAGSSPLPVHIPLPDSK